MWAWHFAAVSKTMAGMGHVTRACKDAFHLAGAVRETHESDMLDGQGAHFLRGILEHQIFGFAKIMSRVQQFFLAQLFVAGAVLTHGVETRQKALLRGRQVCIQLSIFDGSLAELLRF